MPGLDRKLDPATGDYVDDGAGGTETTRSALTAVYHQGRTPRGGWVGDPSAGIRDVPGKSSERTQRVVEDVWREAMAPLVAEGRITEPEVITERNGDQIRFAVASKDLQTGEQLQLADQPEVNP
jgi:hypothetical protein